MLFQYDKKAGYKHPYGIDLWIQEDVEIIGYTGMLMFSA